MLRFVIVSAMWVVAFYGAFKLWTIVLRPNPAGATAVRRAAIGTGRAVAAIGAVLLSALVLYFLILIVLALSQF